MPTVWKSVSFTTFAITILGSCFFQSSLSFVSLLASPRKEIASPLQCATGHPSQQVAIHKFATEIQSACHNGTFVSFTLSGSKKNEKEDNFHRRILRSAHGRTIHLKSKKKDDLYLQVTLKFHGTTDIAQNFKVSNPFLFQDILQMMNESSSSIQRGELVTLDGSWILADTSCRFKVTKGGTRNQTIEKLAVSLPHDRPKNVLLPTNSSFFIKLGISNAEGKPRPLMESKLRQCQHFVETVSGLLQEVPIDEKKHLTTVDMGCGRGYLTFALHAYLSQKYDQVHSYGVEIRPGLVQEINGIARELGQPFDSLQFLPGSIEDFQFNEDKIIDVLIALHACDTATDDAISFGIQHGAKVIVTAPCCHKQVRRQLDGFLSKKNICHPYQDLLRHNIYRERIAESVTDSLRALLLEIAGYNVKVFEFVGGEHTSKNVMIAATKRTTARSSTQLSELRDRLRTLAGMHGIRQQKLAYLLAETLFIDENNDDRSKKRQWTRSMPPIKESRFF